MNNTNNLNELSIENEKASKNNQDNMHNFQARLMLYLLKKKKYSLKKLFKETELDEQRLQLILDAKACTSELSFKSIRTVFTKYGSKNDKYILAESENHPRIFRKLAHEGSGTTEFVRIVRLLCEIANIYRPRIEQWQYCESLSIPWRRPNNISHDEAKTQFLPSYKTLQASRTDLSNLQSTRQ